MNCLALGFVLSCLNISINQRQKPFCQQNRKDNKYSKHAMGRLPGSEKIVREPKPLRQSIQYSVSENSEWQGLKITGHLEGFCEDSEPPYRSNQNPLLGVLCQGRVTHADIFRGLQLLFHNGLYPTRVQVGKLLGILWRTIMKDGVGQDLYGSSGDREMLREKEREAI